MYEANLLIIGAVVMMVALWAGFMVWAARSGQFKDTDRTRLSPFHDDEPLEGEGGDERRP